MNLPVRTVSIVQAASADRELYQRYLLADSSCDYQLLWAESPGAAVELCRTRSIDVVLLGCSSDVDSLSLLRTLNDLPAANSSLEIDGPIAERVRIVPPTVIMIAAVGDLTVAVGALKLGAHDYLVQQHLTPELLQSAIGSAVEQTRLRRQSLATELDLHAAHQYLQESEYKLAVGMQVAGVALVRVDYATNLVALSPEAAAIFGIDRLEVSREHLHATFHPDDRDEFMKTCAQSLDPAGAGWFACEHRVVLPSGEVRWLGIRKQVFFDRAGAVARPSHAILAAVDITERKQTESALIESDRKFSAIFAQTFAFIGIVSLEGVLLEANQTALDAIAASRSDVVGKKFWDCPWWHSPELKQQLRESIDRATTGKLIRYEMSFPNACQEVIYLDFSLKPVFDELGRVEMLVAEGADITERKQTEAALLESERKFSVIFNQTFEFIGLLNLEGVLQEVNQSALEAIAVNKRDVIGKNVWETPWFSHSAELQCQIRDSLALAAQGEFVRYEMYFPDRQGETLFTDFSLKPIFDAAGRVVSTIAEGYNITERKLAETALIKSEERFRTLADNISQLAWMADADGGIFWYNRRCFEYLGTTLEQMQGWGWSQFHHPEHIDRVVDRFRVCLASGESWEDTFPFRGADGNYRWFLSRAIPIRDAQGQIVQWFGTNTDITDLQAAQSELEERNHELDSFGHIVAHDLKAPLRAIANLAEWIAEDLAESLSPDTQQQMLLLQSRVERMSGLIDGLLNYARVGRVDSTRELVILAELLIEVIDSLAPPSTFTVSIPPNLPTLNANPLLLSQVFANLLGNAIKYHERVDGTVSVMVTDCGECYEFAVADDGPGIEPNYLEQIFTIFRTGTPQNRQDSTGIGLAIVKKIVEAQAGTIRVESEIGKGTTFHFTWRK